MTKSTQQLKYLLDMYYKFLPKASFPYIPFIIAAFFQSLAWMSGPIFLDNYSLLPRMLILLLFAAGEYLFMSPAMNAGVEILGMKELYYSQIFMHYVLANGTRSHWAGDKGTK